MGLLLRDEGFGVNDYFSNFQRDPAKVRVARRFREFVMAPKKPRGVIVRLPCCMCPIYEANDRPIEAHHIDYKRWWLVVWVCPAHHRQLDHAASRAAMMRLVDPSWICDYGSLVRNRKRLPYGPGDPAARTIRHQRAAGIYVEPERVPF